MCGEVQPLKKCKACAVLGYNGVNKLYHEDAQVLEQTISWICICTSLSSNSNGNTCIQGHGNTRHSVHGTHKTIHKICAKKHMRVQANYDTKMHKRMYSMAA